jgi:hypothetical protein
MNDFVQYDLLSYLSARIPPEREAINPQIERAAALSSAYSALKLGKFLPKKTGKKAAITIPPTFLKELAIKTFFAHGRLKTTFMLSKKLAIGFFFGLEASNLASSAFYFFSFFFSALERYLPLSGSLTKAIVPSPKRVPTTAMIP